MHTTSNFCQETVRKRSGLRTQMAALASVVFILSAICAPVLPAIGEGIIEAYGLQISESETYLQLTNVNVQNLEEFMAVLDRLPGLAQVDMYESKLKRAQIEELAEKYPGIRFGWTLPIGDHKVRTDTTAFSTLHNNKSKEHTSRDFELLKYCWQLEALDIGHNKVKDLEFLRNFPNLKVLILACDQVDNIDALASLTQLEYLELFKNNITDISALAGMENLLDLNICFNRLAGEEAYAPLMELKSLRRLWLYNSNNYSSSSPVNAKWVANIKEALPDCHVDAVSYSTQGGWREHSRYDTIFKVFKTSVYEPFTYFGQ